MVKKITFTLTLVALTTLAGGAQDAKSLVSTTSKAMGADQLKTIQLSGSGMEYAFGQAYNPSSPWPGWKMKSETRTIDFDAPAMRIERVDDAVLQTLGGDVLRSAVVMAFSMESLRRSIRAPRRATSRAPGRQHDRSDESTTRRWTTITVALQRTARRRRRRHD